MTSEEIKAYCRERKWQPLPRAGLSIYDPDVVPVWGHSVTECLDSWHEINQAWHSGKAFWISPLSAVFVPREKKDQLIIALKAKPVGQRKNGSLIHRQILLVECMECGQDFEHETDYGFRSVPEYCPVHQPVLSKEDLEDRPERKPKAAPTLDAVRDALDYYRSEAETALLEDVLSGIIPRMNEPKGRRDTRKDQAMAVIRKQKDIRVDGDEIIFL